MEHLRMGPGDFACDISDDFPAPAGVTKLAWALPSRAPDSLGPAGRVIHLAARSSVHRSTGDAAEVYASNVAGTVSVLEYAVERCPGARFLLVSSSDVYGSSNGFLAEGSPLAPRSPYAGSKAAAETAARQFEASSGLDLLIARPFPHFGPFQSADFVLPAFASRIVRALRHGGREIEVGNLAPVRDFTYVSDVVAAYEVILDKGARGEVYNVCSGEGRSIGEMLGLLFRIAGADFRTVAGASLARPSDILEQVGDPAKLERLGWRRSVSLEKGLSELLGWWEGMT